MPRTPEFDRERVLDAAMMTFWRLGYRQTTVRELSARTQLQAGSLYGAFRDKRGLFNACLEYYANASRRNADRYLRDAGSPMQRIRRFLDHLVDRMARDPDAKGCLLVNTLLEMPPEEPETRRVVDASLEYVEHALAEVLSEAKAVGEIQADADPARSAKLIMTGILGLRVYARRRPSAAVLRGIGRDLLHASSACTHGEQPSRR